MKLGRQPREPLEDWDGGLKCFLKLLDAHLSLLGDKNWGA
jgi:hypothetical protein